MNRGNARYPPEEEYYSDEDEDSCCVCISHTFVFWSNVLLLIIGLAGMGLSIYLWCIETLEWAGDDIALRFTMFSAFLILIAMLGIQGTWDEVQRCDLVVYLLLLIVVVIAQIGVVIYIAVNEGEFKDYLEGIWDDWSDARKLQAMETYECGVYQGSSSVIPGFNGTYIDNGANDITTCADPTGTETTDYCFDDCWEELKSSFTTFGTLTTVLLIIFAVFELTLLVCSWIVVCNSWEDDYSSEEESDRCRARL